MDRSSRSGSHKIDVRPRDDAGSHILLHGDGTLGLAAATLSGAAELHLQITDAAQHLTIRSDWHRHRFQLAETMDG